MEVSNPSYYIHKINENKGSQMGHTNKSMLKKSMRIDWYLLMLIPVLGNNWYLQNKHKTLPTQSLETNSYLLILTKKLVFPTNNFCSDGQNPIFAKWLIFT